MAKYLHNVSGETKTYQGREILDSEYCLIPAFLYQEYAENETLLQDIQNGLIKVSRDGVNDIETVENALIHMSADQYRVSLAVDKNNIDQFVSGTDPVVVTADRILWDLHEDYDVETDDIVVPADGVYSFDCQIKLNNFSNLASVELAIFKRDQSGDDYWFVLDKKSVSGLNEIQLSGSTEFDFYKDERYCLKLILYKTLPLVGVSCSIEGNDDYTAWGYSLRYLF